MCHQQLQQERRLSSELQQENCSTGDEEQDINERWFKQWKWQEEKEMDNIINYECYSSDINCKCSGWLQVCDEDIE